MICNSDAKRCKLITKLPDTTRSLPIALIRAREAIMLPIREMLSDTDVTEQQWRVLRVLSENGLMTANELAKKTALLMPSLTRISAAMVKKKLVTQVRDRNDRRRQVITITDEGRIIIAEKSEQAANIIEGFRDTLGHDDYERLLDLLSRFDTASKESE